MVLFRIPNISYLVLNRETRKRVMNTRGGAKMIGHTLEGRFKQSHQKIIQTRSSWLNCALRDDEAVYWVNKGHYEAVAVGN